MPEKKPNIILVITDDQGYGDLGCHGNPIINTPNLDKLHSQSVRFNLKAGVTDMQTFLTDADGKEIGAYYVYVQKVS